MFSGALLCLNNLDGSAPKVLWPQPSASGIFTPISSGFTSSPCADSTVNNLYIGDVGGIFYGINADTGSVIWQNPAAVASANTNNGMFSGTTGETTVNVPFGAFKYSTPVVTDNANGYRQNLGRQQ